MDLEVEIEAFLFFQLSLSISRIIAQFSPVVVKLVDAVDYVASA
jgi:hypothetical protein